MDSTTQIVVYSQDERFFDMMSKWSKERFNIVKPVRHISTEADLYAVAEGKENVLLFYFSLNWSNEDSDLVRYVKIQNPDTKIVMVSTVDVALSAWRRDAFYFVPLRNTDTANDETAFFLNNSYKKFSFIGKNEANSLTIRFNGQLTNIPFQDICYVKADGNYCDIVTTTMKKITITKQLGKIEELCKGYTSLVRVGKSLIVNTNRIKTIDLSKRSIHFLSAKPIELTGLSPRYMSWVNLAMKK